MAKKKKIIKTLIEKMLDKAQIVYEPLHFSSDELAHGTVTGAKRAEYETLIYKTLVLEGDKTGYVIGVVSLTTHLDEKKLAAASKNKKVKMVPQRDLLKVTGYEHGANSPIGIHAQHDYPIFYDTSFITHQEIIISSGKVGASVKVRPQPIVSLTEGQVVDLT